MLRQQKFGVEPWAIRETGPDLDDLGPAESVFALANGHIGLRGNLDEGEPFRLPGTYLNSFFEYRPLPHAEGGYGYPESGQAVLNVTNGKVVLLMVDDIDAPDGFQAHSFWDTETFVLPMLSHTAPDAAADALRWRQTILPEARARSSDSPAPRSPGGPSAARSAPVTGRPAPPPSTSTRTSPTR